ncbi:MAG: hypothetical protein D6722_03015 [Bacteroidetes bacterium]|nr:MAG: hypothetical protein D6722_03015 [Bacteroidota bacterium]
MNMQSLSLKIFALVALFSAILTSCTPDPEPPVDPIGPAISLEFGGVIDTATVPIDSSFVVRVKADAGDGAITRIEVQENGALLSDLDRIFFDGDPAGGNPSPIPAADSAGFTWDITIVASSTPDETNTYTIRIVDSNGKSDDVSVEITTVDPTTPVEIKTAYLLLNAGGPAGTGGLDLHSGDGTGSFTDSTDLRDMGIDINQPLASNWIQKISTDGLTTGAVLKVPAAGLDYDAVTTQEQVIAAYEAGTTVVGASDKVEIGDLFLVYSEDPGSEFSYFLLKVVDINITTNNNQDYYEFEVKQ